MLTCVYVAHWKPEREQRGPICGKPIASGSKVPLCPAHASLVCSHCRTPATRRHMGRDLCQRTACGA